MNYFCHYYCDITVSFLIAVFSKLFLSQPMIFAFRASNSPLHPVQGSERCMVWRVSVGILSCGAPFLNHDRWG